MTLEIENLIEGGEVRERAMERKAWGNKRHSQEEVVVEMVAAKMRVDESAQWRERERQLGMRD